MPEAIDLGQFNVAPKAGKREEVVKLATALFLAKILKEATDNSTPFHEAMERIMQNPETVGAVLIMTLNMFYRITGPNAFSRICDYLVNEAMD